MTPIKVDTGTLRAEKARNELTNELISLRSGHSIGTVIRALRGHEQTRLSTLRDVAAQLGLQVEVRFKPACARCDDTRVVTNGLGDATDYSWVEDCICVDGKPVAEEEIPL